jgi:WD40 repeat protein
VIKRAYILAKQQTGFSSIANRVQAMLFLATPHRGADYAQLLSKILSISPGPRPFVMDLHRNSLSTQSINEEFPRVCQELQLFSFYETLQTNILKSLIVDKDLAILGYENERTAYLNADHRGVCKYATKRDPNYQTVRNALATVLDDFRKREATSRIHVDHEQLKLIDSFLGTSDDAEDDFTTVDNARMTGSCEWLMKKTSYLEWLNSGNNQFYWISAKPATGKTILSGKVISHLKGLRKDCSFCFFDYGNKAKSNIASFLLSMARQMALIHPEILRAILDLCRKDDQLKERDYRTTWRILYVECILKQKLAQPQYWVIDALDECHLGHELVPILAKVMSALPVRIFLTSRESIQDHRGKIPGETKVVPEEISKTDTISDIQLYLERHMDGIPADNEENRQAMKNRILMKSNGCFLWVSLVLQELKGVHTADDIRAVLEDVPSDMDELYSRILEVMSEQPKGTKLAKAILTWTVCAARPLTTAELHYTVQSELKMAVYDIERAIKSYCGQLVYVDAQSRVQVIHQTVRDYLLRVKSTSDFGIAKRGGHKQLAIGCLEYLNSPELAGPSRRQLSTSNIHAKAERSAFASYACNYLFEHLSVVSSTDDEILYALDTFLRSSNVLSWIEYVAQHSDLKRLIQTGKALKNFLQRRSKHMNPFGREIALLDSWAIDLVRLVAKFGKNLLENPSSIHHLIPPFCPPESAPRKLFAAHNRGIQLVGLSNKTWGDCLSTIIDAQEQFSSLGCSATYFAIGMNSGTIRIFNQTTCQEVKTLRNKHKTPVRLLRFGVKEGILVSAGSKMVRVWDTVTWTQRWEFKIPALPISISLAEEDQKLLLSLKNNHFNTWDLTSGTQKYSDNWTQDLEGQRALSFSRPMAAACNVEERLLAVVYRGQDILLWDFDLDELLETYTKEGSGPSSRRTVNGGVISVVFGAGPNHSLLAAAYLDGDLVVFDTNEGIVKNITLANAQVLASSPDGRTLATGDSSGTIQLYDLETLKLLYRIRSDDYAIKSLKFSRDSCRVLDIRASQCQVWDPIVLVRQDTEEELSDTVSISTAPQEFGTEPLEEVVRVTSLACHKSNEVFFVGKDDGAVYLHETRSGTQVKKLFSHADGVAVVGLYFDEHGSLLGSIDSSSRVIIHKLLPTWEVSEPIFDHRAGVAVDQLLFNHKYSRVLICSAMVDTLWEIDLNTPEETYIIQTNEWDEVRSYRWATHPTNEDHLIMINDRTAHIYDWRKLQKLTRDEGISLDTKIDPELTIRSIIPCFHCCGIATAFGESSNRHCKSKLLVWNASDFTPVSTSAKTIEKYHHLTDDIDFLIHADDQKLVFLHSDNWICSTDPEKPSNVIRHFFLPADWLTSNVDLMIEMTPAENILFAKRDEVAVIKRGLRNREQSVSQSNGNRRPSPLPGGRRPSNQLSPHEARGWSFQESAEMTPSDSE